VINDSAELKKAVDAAIASNPQLAALVSWEMDVLAAAGATLSALLNLVPSNQKDFGLLPGALDIVLSRLARAAVGAQNVGVNPPYRCRSSLGAICGQNPQPGDI